MVDRNVTGEQRQPAIPGRSNIRVLLVGLGLAGGGAQNRFRKAAEHLLEGGAEVAVLDAESASQLLPGRQVLDLRWAGVWSYPRMILSLRRCIKEHAFDAVVAFGFHPNLITWAAVSGRRRRQSVVLTEINSPYREHLVETGPRGAIRNALRQRIYRSADLYAANSVDGVDDAIRHYGVRPERARRLPNLADTSLLAELASQHVATPLLRAWSVCIVGRLDPRKRVDTLLHAAAGLARDLDWQIDVVGDGDHRAELERLARQLDIERRVVFHGWLANPHPLVARATASVLCSEYEGFSNSVLESMVLGTSVITSLCTSDAHEMVRQGAALGFPVGDSDALREQVVRLLTDAPLRQRLGDEARRYAAVHQLPHAIAAYDALVRDAVAAHGTPS